MTLLAGGKLVADELFFAGTTLRHRGSSIDLTIGAIYDKRGKEVRDPFVLKPGRMVQVVSAEVFNLPPDVTGHVTYKTNLTRKGIWALTVGIVDPGWTGPVSTTLLNFSGVDYAIESGEAFLRVSFFRHDPVDGDHMPKPVDEYKYRRDVRKSAMTVFPQTFLKYEDIVREAGDDVLKKIQTKALVWVGAIAVLFVIINISIQVVGVYTPDVLSRIYPIQKEIMEKNIETLKKRITEMENTVNQRLEMQGRGGS